MAALDSARDSAIAAVGDLEDRLRDTGGELREERERNGRIRDALEGAKEERDAMEDEAFRANLDLATLREEAKIREELLEATVEAGRARSGRLEKVLGEGTLEEAEGMKREIARLKIETKGR